MPDMFKYSPGLKQCHLFRGLDDEQLAWVLDQFEEYPCEQEKQIFAQHEMGDGFFYIIRGKVTLTAKSRGAQVAVRGIFGPNDYFGETALLRKQGRAATATAEAGTLLLRMSTENFRKLIKRFPVLKERFEFVAASRTQQARQNFTWLLEDETVYYLSRKNWIVLLRMQVLPALVLAGVLLTLGVLMALGMSLASLGWLGIIPLALSIGWVAWRWVDWGNDFYIITNKRVVWLEKVVALYDSRQEAALRNILSVESQIGAIGRVFNFGDVSIRAFTTQIVFSDINDPRLAESMIKEYWERAKSGVEEESNQVLRERLQEAISPPPAPPPTLQPPKKKTAKTPPFASGLQPLYFEHFARMMFQGEGITSYRKHIYILIRNSLVPILVLLGAGVGFYLLVGGNLTIGLLLVGLLGAGGIFLWWLYIYVDWANDLYLVTSDQIVDIYRKPLGREVRTSAPLENILSVQYKRRGITGQIFNFGTVFITVGDMQIDFVDVFNPAMVQQEITNRANRRIAKKKEADMADENKRMTDWLTAYHQVENKLQNTNGSPKTE